MPFHKLPENLEIKLQNISDILEQSCQKYQFGCNLTFMNTNEKLFDFQHLTGFTSEQLQLARLDLTNLRKEVSDTLLTNETNRRENRAAPPIAFGALTALTAGAGIACSLVVFLMNAEAAIVIETISITP